MKGYSILEISGQRPGGVADPGQARLLNAGCRVTSIQRFLGHKELSSTMVYARAHDQTVADDYFAAMERVEQKLEIVPVEQEAMEDVKVQVVQLIERLEVPELCLEERLEIVAQLREVLGKFNEHAPPVFSNQN
jgi:hypothetical protein